MIDYSLFIKKSTSKFRTIIFSLPELKIKQRFRNKSTSKNHNEQVQYLRCIYAKQCLLAFGANNFGQKQSLLFWYRHFVQLSNKHNE